MSTKTNSDVNHIVNLQNYTGHTRSRTLREKASGGSTIHVDKSYPTDILDITYIFKVTAITIHLKEKLTLCNIYLSNQQQFDTDQLENIIKQLPQPFIFVGDFNSHYTLWDCKNTNARGKKIEKLLYNIFLLNDNSPIHYNAANGSLSSVAYIGLFSLSTNLQCTVESELNNSDHWPIQILSEYRNIYTILLYTSKENWNLKAPNWGLFIQLVEIEL